MAEQISSTGDIWAATFDNISVDFNEEGKMVITTRPGLFDTDGEKVADHRPSKSGKTQVVASTGGNKPVMTLKNGKTLVIGFTAYMK